MGTMAFLTEVGINILVELELSVCPVATLLEKKKKVVIPI